MNGPESTDASAEPALASRRDWLGLAVIALPCLVYAMDLTVLELALPRISEELGPRSATLLWIVDIYGFLVAGLLITMGNLGDRIGRRRLLLLGGAGFGAASVVAALSRSSGMLIAARALLGIAGATLAPSTLSLIRNMFPHPRQRTFAIGVWTASYSIGGALGPLLGGVVLRFFHWSSVFLLAVPVMVLLLVFGPVLLPEFRDRTAKRLDLGSAALSLAAVLAVTFGLKLLAQEGVAWLPFVSMAAGIALGAAFARRQRGLEDPLIDLVLLRSPMFAASLARYMLATLVTFGSYFVVAQYLQLVGGLSPLVAGLWMLPWSGSYVVGSFVAPVVARRVPPALVMAGGLVLAACGFVAVALAASLGVEAVIIGSTVYSLGMSPVFTLGIDSILSAAPPRRAGAASGISETCSELGGALGIAVLGSLGTAVYREHFAGSALPGVPAGARQAALETLGGAVAAAGQLTSPGAQQALLGTAKLAFTEAMQVTLLVCAAVSLATAIGSVIASRKARSTAPATPPRIAEPGASPS
jgi:DHA2 family multidrug resistance protein-like MFS transporter